MGESELNGYKEGLFFKRSDKNVVSKLSCPVKKD